MANRTLVSSCSPFCRLEGEDNLKGVFYEEIPSQLRGVPRRKYFCSVGKQKGECSLLNLYCLLGEDFEEGAW